MATWIWFLLNFLSIALLAFYSMMEMACVSFNRIRLQYYVTKGVKRAILLQSLLANPSMLFGTTLIMVNVAIVVGSQCSRESYAAVGWNPNLAPLLQIALVVIFGELAPMFAARRYAEHVALLGAPLLFASAWLLHPFLWFIKLISRLVNRLIGGKEEDDNLFLTAEELQKVLERVLAEQSDDHYTKSQSEELNAIVVNLFQVRGKVAKQVMSPLKQLPILTANSTVAQMRQLVQKQGAPYAIVCHRSLHNIIGMVFVRDLLRAKEGQLLRPFVRPAWFVTEKTPLMHILKQFRHHVGHIAVVLNSKGLAAGVITLDEIVEETLGKRPAPQQAKMMLIDRTFDAETKVAEVNASLGITLDPNGAQTLAELFREHLGHIPEEGDSITLGPFVLTVKEVSLLEVKSIAVTTHH